MNNEEPIEEDYYLKYPEQLPDAGKEIEKEAEEYAKYKIAEASVIEGYIAGATAERERCMKEYYHMNLYKVQAYEQIKQITELRAALKELIPIAKSVLGWTYDPVRGKKINEAIERAKSLTDGK